MSAATNCPTCPACECPTGTTLARESDERLLPPRLRCCACGDEWDATPDQYEQARAADDAWERGQRRERRIF